MLTLALTAALAAEHILPPSGWHLSDPLYLHGAAAHSVHALPPDALGDRLLVINDVPSAGAPTLTVFSHTPKGFHATQKWTLAAALGGASRIVVHDLTRDGRADAVIVGETTWLLSEREDGLYDPPRQLPGDGKPTVVHSVGSDPGGVHTWSVVRRGTYHTASPRGPVSLPVLMPNAPQPNVLAADHTADGLPRLLTVDWVAGAHRLYYWPGAADGGWQPATIDSQPLDCGPNTLGAPFELVLTELPGSPTATTLAVLQGECVNLLAAQHDGTYTRWGQLDARTPSGWGSFSGVIADLDGDGLNDIVLVGQRDGLVLWRSAPTPGTLSVDTLEPFHSNAPNPRRQRVAVLDATGNGCADVVLARGAEGLIVLEGRACGPDDGHPLM